LSLLLIALLALVQGLTEFLPISSSAHLILANQLTGEADQGLVFDVAAHLGSLLGVVFFFRVDLIKMLRNQDMPDYGYIKGWELIGFLCICTAPVCVIGLIGADWIESTLRFSWVIALSTITFGGILWLANSMAKRRCQKQNPCLNTKIALYMGIAQILALIPGASRSGVTLSAGIFAGLKMERASRFALLMGIPTLSAAGSFGLYRMLTQQTALAWNEFVLTVMLSALAAWFCIGLFLRFVERIGLMPFVIYRFALGAVILFFIGF